MFTISEKDKGPVCQAKRCHEPKTSHGLCERHHREWVLAGRPEFTYGKTAVRAEDGDTKTALTNEITTAQRVYDKVRRLPLETPEQIEYAHRVRAAIEHARDKHRAQRDAALSPLLEAVERIRTWAKPAGLRYDQALELLDQQLRTAERASLRPTSSGRPPAPPKPGVRRGRLPPRSDGPRSGR